MEKINSCRICGSIDRDLLYSYGAPDKARVLNYICKGCGVVYQIDRMGPAELRDYYFRYSNKVETIDLNDARFEDWFGQIAGLRFNFLKGYLKKYGSVLDVGCGGGFLLQRIKRHDRTISVLGINPERSYADYGRRRFGLNIASVMFEEAALAEGSCDMVIFDHVFEHINEPKEALKKVDYLLKEDGYIFICTNNVLTPHGFLWQNFFLDHPFTYSPNTITRLLAEFNFEVLEMDIKGHITYEGYHYPYMTLVAGRSRRLKKRNMGDDPAEVKKRLYLYNRSYCLSHLYHTMTYNMRIYVSKFLGRYPAAFFYLCATRPLPARIRPRLFNHTLPPERTYQRQ